MKCNGCEKCCGDCKKQYECNFVCDHVFKGRMTNDSKECNKYEKSVDSK